MKKPVLALLALFATTSALAQERVHVIAGHLLDPATGKVLDNQAILIEGGLVVKVAAAADLPHPEGARHVDLSGFTVLPGLLEAHAHLTGDADEQGYRALAISIPREALKGAKNARITLEAGFTTVRNLGAGGYSDIALRDAIDAHEAPGPHLLVSGPPVGITGGHCSDNNLLPPEYDARGDGVADGPWAARAAVRRNVKYGVDLIKTCSTGGVLSKGTEVGAAQNTPEELAAIVDEAHMHGRKVASHAHGATGIKNALKAGVDSIEHASFIDGEGIALAKKTGAVLVMDVYNTEYILGMGEAAGFLPESLEKERRTGATQRANFEKAVEAGVTMGFGSDSGVYPHGDNARQFSRMVRFGMTPLQAIQAATTVNARLFGLEGKAGTLAPGAWGDLIAVRANPLEEIETLEDVPFVMKEGVTVKDKR